MDHRSIGSLRVSVVGIGCNNFGMRIDAAATERVVHAALDAGINFFDNADIYGATKSEEFLGRAPLRRSSTAIPNFVATIARSRCPLSARPRNSSLLVAP